MHNRQELNAYLKTLCNNVYFQPPETVKMTYPAIVYELSNMDNRFGDDSVYKQFRKYSITVIDKSPVSTIADNLSKTAKTSFDRCFVSDNLNHYVFTIYI